MRCYGFVTVLFFFGDFFDFLRMLAYTDSELPNPDEPERNRCAMISQKIEVGHTLKSKNAAAFLLFKVTPQ